jgi:peroxiredoxin
MLELDTPAPAFTLPDPSGTPHGFDDHPNAKGYLVVFLCNHCPFVKHIASQLGDLCRVYQGHGIASFGINSNDATEYPDDSPERMEVEAKRFRFTFPYLFDETQEVAKAFRAACTPDFFLFDADRKLVYRGQFDDSRPGNGKPVTGSDLRAALDSLLEERRMPKEQRPSIGCNIKWKPGNEPDYFGA